MECGHCWSAIGDYISLEPYGLSLFGYRTILHVWLVVTRLMGFIGVPHAHLDWPILGSLLGKVGKKQESESKLAKQHHHN